MKFLPAFIVLLSTLHPSFASHIFPTGRFELKHNTNFPPMSFDDDGEDVVGQIHFTSRVEIENIVAELYDMTSFGDVPTSCDDATAPPEDFYSWIEGEAGTSIPSSSDSSPSSESGSSSSSSSSSESSEDEFYFYVLNFVIPDTINLPEFYAEKNYICVRIKAESEGKVLDQIDTFAKAYQTQVGEIKFEFETITKDMKTFEVNDKYKVDLDTYYCGDDGEIPQQGKDFVYCIDAPWELEIMRLRDVECSFGRETLKITEYMGVMQQNLCAAVQSEGFGVGSASGEVDLVMDSCSDKTFHVYADYDEETGRVHISDDNGNTGCMTTHQWGDAEEIGAGAGVCEDPLPNEDWWYFMDGILMNGDGLCLQRFDQYSKYIDLFDCDNEKETKFAFGGSEVDKLVHHDGSTGPGVTVDYSAPNSVSITGPIIPAYVNSGGDKLVCTGFVDLSYVEVDDRKLRDTSVNGVPGKQFSRSLQTKVEEAQINFEIQLSSDSSAFSVGYGLSSLVLMAVGAIAMF